MDLTILIPHYRNGKATAHALYKIKKHSEGHDVKIFVVDNNPGDGSCDYLKPFKGEYDYFAYPKDRLQSHGISFDYILPLVPSEYFMTIESDSFPDADGWLDFYERFSGEGMDAAGSILRLSGGTYLHPCGALYRKSVWEEARRYINAVEYVYFPNMSMKEGFQCHLMVHASTLGLFLDNPEDYIELADGYKPYIKENAIKRLDYYRPVADGVFHNGMGSNQESIKTYGERTFAIDVPGAIFNNRQKLINRIGYEPGQYFCYYMFAKNKKVVNIATETKWLPNRENQQQEYTLNEAGFRHIWAGSSFLDMKGGDMNDVYEFKKNQIDELYNSMPENLKINE